ncbi:hypothetical protein HMPREF3034_01229 [Prevotella sp. DNF00663]|nr:hypothetical protein HMPREF3034_01229 [Prevotella sp. DNF00663]
MGALKTFKKCVNKKLMLIFAAIYDNNITFFTTFIRHAQACWFAL